MASPAALATTREVSPATSFPDANRSFRLSVWQRESKEAALAVRVLEAAKQGGRMPIHALHEAVARTKVRRDKIAFIIGKLSEVGYLIQHGDETTELAPMGDYYLRKHGR